jgi:hypothetical protein
MSVTYNRLLLRFIRRREGSYPVTDDKLIIRKVGECSVEVTYKEYIDPNDIRVDRQTLSYQQYFLYLYRIFWLLGLDDDPFASVQFFIPGYPSILLTTAKIQQHIQQIMELMISTCWAWPLSMEEEPIQPITLPLSDDSSTREEDQQHPPPQ